jgi:hypothetical protein
VIPKAWVSEQSSKFVLDDKSSESLIPSWTLWIDVCEYRNCNCSCSRLRSADIWRCCPTLRRWPSRKNAKCISRGTVTSIFTN